MYFVFDTNILLFYIRESPISKEIDSSYNPFGVGNTPILPVVSVGEIKSIALRHDWGKKKITRLKELMSLFVIADVNSEDVWESYAEIDAYSQGKLKNKPLPFSARNMGKNDLWIAAITAVTSSKIITSDNDFDHLDGVYFEVIKIVIDKKTE